MRASIDEVTRSLRSARELLLRLNLLSDFNDPVVEVAGKGVKRVTWATDSTRPELSRYRDSTIEEYLVFLIGRHYNFRLVDGSLIQLSYDLRRGRDVAACRAVWFPCPVDFEAEELEIATLDELVLTAPNKELGCRAPLRIDYAPDQAAENHPVTHLHLGFENFRLPVQRPVEPNRFIRLLLRTRYCDLWESARGLISCENWSGQDQLTEEDKLIGALKWDLA